MKKKGLIFGVITIIIIIVIIIIVKIWDYNNSYNWTLDLTSRGGLVLDFNPTTLEAYQGSILGSSLKSLISMLIAHAKSYERLENPLPTVEFIKNDNSVIVNRFEITTENIEVYTSSLQDMKDKFVNSHYYTVELNYSILGLVNKIIITY